MNDEPRETLIEFPTAFPIKALGRDDAGFRETVIEIVAKHATFDVATDVKLQPSSNGKFISVTITFHAENQQQLDTIYQTLHDDAAVLMVF